VRHLGLASAKPGASGLAGLAAACGLDIRDLESGLVRLDLAYGRAMAGCPGGQACTALRQPVPPGPSRPGGLGGTAAGDYPHRACLDSRRRASD
jgi:hypothetical protein